MNIILTLQDYDVRLVNNDKWLWYDAGTDEWIVCQRKRNAKKTVELCRTESEAEACTVLVREG